MAEDSAGVVAALNRFLLRTGHSEAANAAGLSEKRNFSPTTEKVKTQEGRKISHSWVLGFLFAPFESQMDFWDSPRQSEPIAAA
jgi:hypothetical protein